MKHVLFLGLFIHYVTIFIGGMYRQILMIYFIYLGALFSVKTVHINCG